MRMNGGDGYANYMCNSTVHFKKAKGPDMCSVVTFMPHMWKGLDSIPNAACKKYSRKRKKNKNLTE